MAALFALAACGDDSGGAPDGGDGGADAGFDCDLGTQGCYCAEGDRCGSASSELECMDGICESTECTSGESGCACRLGSDCDDGEDSCEDGVCRSADCVDGTKACPCLNGSCDPGLICQDQTTCVDATGNEGGPCKSNNTCEPGNRCDPVQGLCVHCDTGSVACQCGPSDACSSGLTCSAGLCIDEKLAPPSDPVCYTPCRADLVSEDGEATACEERLIEGCLDGLECNDGSCVAEGEDKPSCDSDLDCPFFQACLQGGCYSNCEVDADCTGGLGCHFKVCRAPCSAAAGMSACPSGSTCEAPDGENGFCIVLGEVAEEPAPLPSGGFIMRDRFLQFSNVDTSKSFVLSSEGAQAQEVTIRKLSHVVYNADGTTEEVIAPNDGECDASTGECPLDWLELSLGDESTREASFSVKVPGNCDATTCPEVEVSRAGNGRGVRWEGKLEVCSRNGCAEPVEMTYVEQPSGQWTGTLYYLGTFNDDGVAAWAASGDKRVASNVGNGLVRQWAAFRGGNLDDWSEFLAILTSTREGSWDYGNVKTKCRQLNNGSTSAACYPYTNSQGVRNYVQNKGTTPIPTGVVGFPMAINLASTDKPEAFQGRIVSSNALQFAATPAIELELDGDPSDRGSCDPAVTSDCAMFLKSMESTISVGGRYYATDATCATGYVSRRTPWLVDGFSQNTELDFETGLRYRYECVDAELPYGAGESALNAGLAGANPVPDGRERARSLKLLDGALINQSELFVLFQEELETFIPGHAPASAYGYMILRKTPTDLEPEELVGVMPPETTKAQPERMGVSCSEDVLDKTTVATGRDVSELNGVELGALVRELIDGANLSQSGYQYVDPVQMHVLCEETGLIDGGSEADTLVMCPAWSKVTYFRMTARTQAEIRALPCNQKPTTPGREDVGTTDPDNIPIASSSTDTDSCNEVFQRWVDNNLVLEVNPFVCCADAGNTSCDAEKALCDDPARLDMLEGKRFYTPQAGTGERLLPLLHEIAQAFRYKVRFQSSSGGAVGFAPRICLPESDQIPYCYDPHVIEDVRDRIDCLLDIYTNYDDDLSEQDAAAANKLNGFLRQSFSSFRSAPVGGNPAAFLHEGFERLYAELLVMQGDEALTKAFASRFDLASVGGAAFQGSLFEQNGIDLSGIAGFEMVRLYQAVQYYQLALDRLYLMGPNYASALGSGGTTDDQSVFVSPATVTDYIERLIRAATQKARASSEIAKNYQTFNRPDLARAVVERAYTGTYLESVLIANLMVEIKEKSTNKNLDQIRLEIERAQLRYRMALLEMRDTYQSISDSKTYFGFPADYIPIPALDSTNIRDTNGYEVLSAIARQKVEAARQRELSALDSNRSQQTDAATFQAELVRVRNTYENQLSDICGSFTGDDGVLYPAISKYAHLSEKTTLLGNPCGRMGNGQLYEAIAGVEISRIALRAARLRWSNTIKEIEIEQKRVAEQCGLVEEVAEIQFTNAEMISTMTEEISSSRSLMNFIMKEADAAATAIQAAICEPPGIFSTGTCATAIPAAAVQLGISTAANVAAKSSEERIISRERALARKQNDLAKIVSEKQCDAAYIDSVAKIKVQRLGMLESELEAVRANAGVTLQLAEVQQLVNAAERWTSQQVEAEDLLIDVEAARNDPNVRIYRNDAVLNADITFNDAIRAVYRATRVFEYYSSQSYAKRDQLFLTRMVTAGDYNLENYLNELDNYFFDFEEQFGVPDTRVQILSLRDNIMQIPLLDEAGNPLSQGARIAMMRERLRDVSLLDSNGYLTIPFGTSLDQLSPLTRNHKVRYVEADIVGSDVGDTVGRVYLRAAGTGIIHNLNDETGYYAFPERTAIINTYFNGNRVFDPEVYRNARLRDRPLVNTLWELVINRRDEQVNTDIDLQSLSDIRLLVFYNDFTAF